MKYCSLIVLLFGGYAVCTVINNVRLVDHTSYVLNFISRVVNTVEEKGWWNLKLPEFHQDLYENIITRNISGTVKYMNGFVVSIQKVDIEQSTVQQIWSHDRVTNVTTLTVRGSLRMHEVAVGYDVVVDLEDGHHRYTAVYVHPIINFVLSQIIDPNKGTDVVTVVGTVPVTRLRPVLRPVDALSDVLTTMFNSTLITADGIRAWGPDVFQPITRDVIENQVQFPNICYNCPVTL